MFTDAPSLNIPKLNLQANINTLLIHIHICGNWSSVISPLCCQHVCHLICAILFLTAAHTTHSHGHNRLFRSPKSLCLPTKPGTNNAKVFCDLINKDKRSSQLEARCHRGNNLFLLHCMEIKITFRLAQKVAVSFSGDRNSNSYY